MLNFQKKIINNYFRFSKINIIHLMRNAFDFPSKIIILACNKKLNHDRLGFFNDLSRSTPNK